jgi:Uma2 family endonuclease
MSEADYLVAEERSPVRSEFIDGFVRAMSGGTLSHSRVVTAAASDLYRAGQTHGCRVHTHDVKLKISSSRRSRYYYPDVMVACQESVDERWETDPCLLIEVLSPSTTRTDVVEKLNAYCDIASLEAYIVIDHQGGELVVHRRTGSAWALEGYQRGDSFALSCPPMTVDVNDWLAATD